MKIKQLYLNSFLIFVLFACSNNQQKAEVSSKLASDNFSPKSNIDKEIQKVIKLDYDFEINVGHEEEIGMYSLFILKHKSKHIYLDSSSCEYEFSDKLFPIIKQLSKETFVILVEVNDRPNKNYLSYFKVHKDRIIEIGKLPTFITNASNLDTDKHLEFAGLWIWNETWGENGTLTAYNPILYYELNQKGITLDSALTILKNKEIFGDFYIFKYDENIEMSTSVCKKQSDEIKRIRKRLGN